MRAAFRLALVSLSFSANLKAADNYEPLLNSIKQHWRAQQKSVHSARITYRLVDQFSTFGMRTSGRRNPTLRNLDARKVWPRKFRSMIYSSELGTKPEAMEQIAKALNETLHPSRSYSVRGEFFKRDRQTRDDQIGQRTRVATPTTAVDARSGFIVVSDRLRGPEMTLDDFRIAPPIDVAFDATGVSDDRVTLISTDGQTEVTVDRNSGFILEMARRESKNGFWKNGELLIQFGPRVYMDGLILPTCRVTSVFVDGALIKFTITVIEDATLLGGINPTVFNVSAKAGDVVYDVRGRRHGRISLLDDTQDVVRLIDRLER